MKNIVKKLFITALAVFSHSVIAMPIAGNTCGSPDREATLTNSSQCAFGDSINPDGSVLTSIYGDAWTNEGEVTSNASNGFLTANADGGWGSIPNSGDWEIDLDFWFEYDRAIITMYVEEDAGNPDFWAWMINRFGVEGVWSLNHIPGGTNTGGGLASMTLWGGTDADPVPPGGDVPEPGILALFGIGLFGMASVRRRTRD